jgi:hypothetical protein
MTTKPIKPTKAKNSRKTEAEKPVILCADCGCPVVFRCERFQHFTLTPKPDKEGYYFDTTTFEWADEDQRGLFCTGCEEFLADHSSYGIPHDHEDVPELLKSGRLKVSTSER